MQMKVNVIFDIHFAKLVIMFIIIV
jgi:hypothetical protein